MSPVHFTLHPRATTTDLWNAAMALDRERLVELGRLITGAPFEPTRTEPPMGVGGRDLDRWTGERSDGWTCECWCFGGEAVVFAGGSAEVLDYTIQSSFELGCADLSETSHECAEDCGMCLCFPSSGPEPPVSPR